MSRQISTVSFFAQWDRIRFDSQFRQRHVIVPNLIEINQTILKLQHADGHPYYPFALSSECSGVLLVSRTEKGAGAFAPVAYQSSSRSAASFPSLRPARLNPRLRFRREAKNGTTHGQQSDIGGHARSSTSASAVFFSAKFSLCLIKH
jgi:hypothetical protein